MDIPTKIHVAYYIGDNQILGVDTNKDELISIRDRVDDVVVVTYAR